jgi:hypothetical protein
MSERFSPRKFRHHASVSDTKRRILREWMWAVRPIKAKPVLVTDADPRRALRELREADPTAYALLTEHLVSPFEDGPDGI